MDDNKSFARLYNQALSASCLPIHCLLWLCSSFKIACRKAPKEELKSITLDLELKSLEKQNYDSKTNSKSTQNPSHLPSDIFRCCKYQNIGKTIVLNLKKREHFK